MEILFARAGTCSSLPWQNLCPETCECTKPEYAADPPAWLPPQLRKPCLVKKAAMSVANLAG